jgi:UDP-N-acetylmuramoylalanine--D-glutamate ligase
VCEVSSFQLEDTLAFAPEAAVLLNLSPDHLDRHGTFEAYLAAKLRDLRRQGNDDVAVAPRDLGVEDLGGCAGGSASGRRGRGLSERRRAVVGGAPLLRVERAPPARRATTCENAMAAAAVCLARGVDADAVRAGLRSFAGVRPPPGGGGASRRRAYVNDSKATNVASTLVALDAFAGRPST